MNPDAVQHISVSRRRLLAKSAAAAATFVVPCGLTKAAAAGPLTPASMTLDYIYQGSNCGFLVARERGFYGDAGLDVAITAGKGSSNTAQLVASKATQFGFADGYLSAMGVSKGMQIKTVASIYRSSPAAFITLATSSIQSLKDLEGKTLGMTAGGIFQMGVAFIKGYGLDDSKVKLVNLPPNALGPALITGQVDVIGAYVTSWVPMIEIQAKKQVRIFRFADYGMSIVSNGIVAHADTIKNDPEFLRKFVPASIKGFLYARQHPDEAAAIVKKYSPTVDVAIVKREFELSWQSWTTPNTGGKPLGWGSDADWATTLRVLKQYGGVATPPEASQVYTNDFVPTGADYVPPQ